MDVAAHNPPSPRKQRIRSPRLAIIEFVLKQLPQEGTAGQLLYYSLASNYKEGQTKPHHEIIPFDISNGDEMNEHTSKISRIVKGLEKRYELHI